MLVSRCGETDSKQIAILTPSQRAKNHNSVRFTIKRNIPRQIHERHVHIYKLTSLSATLISNRLIPRDIDNHNNTGLITPQDITEQ